MMSTPKFATTQNLIAFLEKPSESDGFEQIVDFLNDNPIKYALMMSPTIYTSYGKKVVVNEASIRHDLKLNDAEGGIIQIGEEIATIDVDAEVNLENVYNLYMAYEETVLSMQDVDVHSDRIEDVVKDVEDVVATAKNIKAKPKVKWVTMQEPSDFITTLPSQSSLPSHAKDKGKGLMVEPEMPLTIKDQIALDKEAARRQSDVVRKYQALKRKLVSIAQARKNMMIYLKDMAGYKMDYFKGMSYEQIRPIFEMEYNKDNAKNQKLEEQEEAEELKKNLEIVPDNKDDVFMNVTPLSSKPPTNVDGNEYDQNETNLSKTKQKREA
uniref:Uncharacterized protein n=1 Tax=Tanacetum cinerariifolium TaxID=118510 RepID=A0A699I4N9_TANCI|nr:hypothetical protein [Tanacetum cinerariifolium]